MHGVEPTSTSAQVGRLAKIVKWTAEAWVMIQNSRDNWRWMRAEFPSTALTASGTARYTPASWNITDFSRWITEKNTVSMYKNSTGVSDEGDLIYQPDFVNYRRTYERGTITNNRPSIYAISPANEFCLGPRADAVYRLNGDYMKAAVTLSGSSDTPGCPARFHDIIIWKGVVLLADHDEVEPFYIARAQAKFAEFLTALERSQLPQVSIGSEPLA